VGGDGDGAEWQRHGKWEMAGGSARAEMVFFFLAFEFSISKSSNDSYINTQFFNFEIQI
jgi:hypothetical protein